MKHLLLFVLTTFIALPAFADEAPPSPVQETTLKLGYGFLDFQGASKKDKGNRYLVALDHRYGQNLFQLSFENTMTQTFRPQAPHDLHVGKYALKYTRSLDEKQALSIGFLGVEDNLMAEVDEGKIYGIGYKYGALNLAQYFSDYENFNVYQSDASYTLSKKFPKKGVKAGVTLSGKFIHIQDKNSNAFSRNAETNYVTPGLKFHAGYKGYMAGIGALFGKRTFAVMDNGFAVQHHAMEFDKTYMAGIGKRFGDVDIHLKYAYQEATELPIDNEGVEVNAISLQLGYHF